MSAKKEANELRLIREYEAPVQLVWEAWTDPEQTAKWWGPRGFSLTTHSKDLRPGGHWRYTMHGPDGVDYPNHTVYFEVEPLRRLVYDHGGYEDRPPLFRVTVEFEALGKARTRMTMTMRFKDAEEAKRSRQLIRDLGGNSTWDRLAEYLAQQENKTEVFVIQRSFDTKPEALFNCWIQPDKVAQWLGPADIKLEYIIPEIAAGKSAILRMSYPDGLIVNSKMHYTKTERPSCLEYWQHFCDDCGNPTAHPRLPLWPPRLTTRVLFDAEDDGATRLALIWQPDSASTPAEIQAFVEMRAAMHQGWTEAFDKLEALAGKQKAGASPNIHRSSGDK